MKELTFDRNFNQAVERMPLPVGLEKLSFGGACFNQPVEGMQLPAGLKELTFGFNFNQPVEGMNLPAGLKERTFRNDFHQLESFSNVSSFNPAG